MTVSAARLLRAEVPSAAFLSLLNEVAILGRRISEAMFRAGAGEGIVRNEHVLVLVALSTVEMSKVGELGHRLPVAPSKLTRILSKLEQAGFVARVFGRNPDLRVVETELSEVAAVWMAESERCFGLSEMEQRQVAACLVALGRNVPLPEFEFVPRHEPSDGGARLSDRCTKHRVGAEFVEMLQQMARIGMHIDHVMTERLGRNAPTQVLATLITGGEQSVNVLRSATMMSGPKMSRVLATLERAELIIRGRSETIDRRVVRVAVTDAGTAYMARLEHSFGLNPTEFRRVKDELALLNTASQSTT